MRPQIYICDYPETQKFAEAVTCDDTVYDYEILHTRMREKAFLTAGLNISIADKRTEDGESDNMCYEGYPVAIG